MRKKPTSKKKNYGDNWSMLYVLEAESQSYFQSTVSNHRHLNTSTTCTYAYITYSVFSSTMTAITIMKMAEKFCEFSSTRQKLKWKSRQDTSKQSWQKYLTLSLTNNALICLANTVDILCTLIHIISDSAVINIACLYCTQCFSFAYFIVCMTLRNMHTIAVIFGTWQNTKIWTKHFSRLKLKLWLKLIFLTKIK